MKRKVLECLGCGSAARKEDFLQHITEIINWEIKKGETFGEHFMRLEASYPPSPKRAAIQDFIDNQDPLVMTTLIWDAYGFNDDLDFTPCHNFNMYEIDVDEEDVPDGNFTIE